MSKPKRPKVVQAPAQTTVDPAQEEAKKKAQEQGQFAEALRAGRLFRASGLGAGAGAQGSLGPAIF